MTQHHNPVTSGETQEVVPVTNLAIMNYVAVGIYTVDLAGLCTQINPSALAVLGYSLEECLHHDMHTLVHSKREDGTPYPVQDCPLYNARLSGKIVTNAEEVMWHKNGTPIHLACSSSPVVADGIVQGTVVTLNDLTARRAAENLLLVTESEQREVLRQRDAAARIELELADEEVVRQRSAAFALEQVAVLQLQNQRDLLASQKRAEDALMQSERLASVGRLVASISHEINNPLEAVTNLLYLIRHDGTLSEEATEYARMAEEELKRVSQIASQTLRFQRQGIEPIECEPEKLVESVVALYQGRLHHSRIRIERQHRNSRPFVCHEGDVRQILNNLLANAIDAMCDTGGTITIRTQPARCHRTDRKGTRITVADSGHGMSRSTAEHIFEPFFTTTGASGSGLGLWISHTLAERQGGHLRVRSRNEKGHQGTTFSLFLPSDLPAA